MGRDAQLAFHEKSKYNCSSSGGDRYMSIFKTTYKPGKPGQTDLQSNPLNTTLLYVTLHFMSWNSLSPASSY